MLCEDRGAFMFQIRPDLFPAGYMDEVERQLWAIYYEDKQARQKADK
jgi:hypothetical protein